jgi:predicted TIM-barrel fold metal-dependent hydrolase
MYDGKKVIDVHGHMSTPPHFRAYAYNLIALRSPADGGLEISDELMETALTRHLKMLDSLNVDVQMISPRPVAMMHWEQPLLVEKWTRVTNDIIRQQCAMHPGRFVGVAQLPQNGDLDTSNCVRELERCVKELGFIGALVNPDPGADRQAPGMDQPYWYPLYEAAEALNAPLIVHPGISRDPRIAIIPHNYQYNNITEETLATQLLENSDVFDRFPRLRVIICHCGGALRRFLVKGQKVAGGVVRDSGEAAGGQVGMATRQAETPHERDTTNNLFFDTCAYDKDFLTTAIRQRGPRQMLFGTEAPGSGSNLINPETGRSSEDLVPLIDRIEGLSAEDKLNIFHDNAKRVFPLLKAD